MTSGYRQRLARADRLDASARVLEARNAACGCSPICADCRQRRAEAETLRRAAANLLRFRGNER